MTQLRSFAALSLLAALVLLPAAGVRAGAGEILFANSFEGTGDVPQFVAVPPQAGVVERPIAIDIDTTVPDNQAGLSFSLDAAPTGLSIRAASGEIDWIPNALQVGTFPVTVRVEDLAGLSNTLTFDIEVVDPNAVPLIETIDDQTVSPGELLALTVSASDPGASASPNFTLDISPDGMTIDAASGALEWMPSVADLGAHPVTVRATDDGGQFDQESFTVTVAENTAPALEALPDRGGAPSKPVLIQPVADDPDPGEELTWSLAQRPAGMNIDADTGTIRWTPVSLQLGPHDVTVVVRDALGAADEATFEIRVDFNRPPVAVDDGGYRVERGDTLTIDAPGLLGNDVDPNSDPLTALLVDGPERGSLTLDADGGFDYTPDVPVGTVGFVEKFSYDLPGGAFSWLPVIGDLDGDGGADLIVCDCQNTLNDPIIALDGDSGAELWTFPFSRREIDGSGQPALADIDRDGFPELLVLGGDADVSPPTVLQLYAFEHDGGLKWVSDPLPRFFFLDGVRNGSRTLSGAAITVADLDQDGFPEIIAAPNSGPSGYHVWDREGRSLQSVHEPGTLVTGAFTRVTIVDLDLDGDPEIVVGNVAWSHDGTLLWKRTDDFVQVAATTFPVVANLDDDPYPELVRSRGGGGFPDRRGNVVAWNHDGTDLWEHSAPLGFNTGPLTIADVDADGYADVLFPNHLSVDLLEVLDGRDGSVKWSKAVDTRSTGASVIDLDRDGFVEVVFVDRNGDFHVWDGRDGSDKLFLATDLPQPTNWTVPIFADVDNDGAAEMIVNGGFDFGITAAVSVWESPADDWPPMRPVWNEHRYRVTNVNDDLTIPTRERPHWLLPGLNQAMINQRLPEARIEDRDGFTYRASDGELQSNVAEVSIEILPPNTPPRILSTPPRLASPGFEYVYDVLAVDADAGEQLAFTIAEGPAGMTVSAEGRVAWLPGPGDLGLHPVVVGVTDTLGVAAFQNFVIDVQPAVTVPDLAGLDEAAAVAALEQLDLRADPLRDTFSDTVATGRVAAQSPAAGVAIAAGGAVEVEISRGPVPVQVPDMLTLNIDDALAALTGAGLSAGTVEFVNDHAQPVDTVLSQDPAPRSSAPPGSSVDLTVSGGPRAVIEVTPAVIPAGASATVSVSVRDIDGTPLDPQPTVTLALDIDPTELTGTPPTLSAGTITTSADSQGAFDVLASFGAESFGEPAVIAQPISAGSGADVYSEFAAQLGEYRRIVAALDAALDAGDSAAIETLDQQLGDLLAALDTRRLRTLSPIAPEGGVPPSPSIAETAGLLPGPDDQAYREATLDLLVVIEELERVLSERSAPDAVIDALNQELAETASVLAALEPDVYAVLDASGIIISLLGTRVPRMVRADIEAVRAELRDAGLVSAPGTAAAARFTLPGLMSATRIRSTIVNDFYVPYLGDVARAMGTIAAADLLQPYVNGASIVGTVTGGSLALHVFEIPNSVIEGIGFDPTLSPNNAVTMVGPELIDAVQGALSGLPSAKDFKDLNSIMDTVQTQIDNADAVDTAWKEANSSPMGVQRGCILDNRPTCRQLVYPDGFASVYQVDSGLSLPAPVLLIVRNLESGGIALFVANFVPTRDD